MDASPAMQVVARIGVGYDAVEVPALSARRVPLMVAGTANSTSVAEQAFHLIIALAKKNRHMDALVKDDKWTARHAAPPMELSGKNIIIVGFGRIGTRTARRCAAFDMNVQVYDPYMKPGTISAAGYKVVADLDAALPTADIVSIHCPKNPETVNMFDTRRFGLMKKGAFIVNTARGGIINEPALYQALKSGHIAGAGPRRVRSGAYAARQSAAVARHSHFVTAHGWRDGGSDRGDGRRDVAEHPERAGWFSQQRERHQPRGLQLKEAVQPSRRRAAQAGFNPARNRFARSR